MKRNRLALAAVSTLFVLFTAASWARAMEPRDTLYSALGFTGGLIEIEDMDDPFFMFGAPVRFRLMPIAFQFNGEFSREDYLYSDEYGDFEGQRSLFSLDASIMLYPIPPFIPVQPYLIGGGHLFYAWYDDADFEEEDGSDSADDYGNGYHAGAGIDFHFDDVILNFEGRRLWINEDKWGLSDRQGFRFTVGLLFKLG